MPSRNVRMHYIHVPAHLALARPSPSESPSPSRPPTSAQSPGPGPGPWPLSASGDEPNLPAGSHWLAYLNSYPLKLPKTCACVRMINRSLQLSEIGTVCSCETVQDCCLLKKLRFTNQLFVSSDSSRGKMSVGRKIQSASQVMCAFADDLSRGHLNHLAFGSESAHSVPAKLCKIAAC